MDDASSISSGEISDAVAGVSTDDNITVGSSLSAHSHTAAAAAAAAAGLTDRAAALASQRAAVLHMGSVTLQTSAARRHTPGTALVTTPGTVPGTAPGTALVTTPGTVPGTVPGTAGRTAAAGSSSGPVFMRRSHQALVTDLTARTLRSGTAVAIDDPARCLATATTITSSGSGVKQKKDSETNTDNSALMMLAAQRGRVQAAAGAGVSLPAAAASSRRLMGADCAPSSRSSSLGRTQSDSRARTDQLQAARKKAMSETDELDDDAAAAAAYYSGSVGRTAAAAAAAAVFRSDELSASGGQYQHRPASHTVALTSPHTTPRLHTRHGHVRISRQLLELARSNLYDR